MDKLPTTRNFEIAGLMLRAARSRTPLGQKRAWGAIRRLASAKRERAVFDYAEQMLFSITTPYNVAQ